MNRADVEAGWIIKGGRKKRGKKGGKKKYNKKLAKVTGGRMKHEGAFIVK
jgi:hypothetical protein